MFGLEALYLGLVISGLNLELYSEMDVAYPAQGQVAQVSFHREWWRSDAKCRFTGLMVPYARDWEETRDDGFTQTTLAPEPDKIAGYAFVINKKTCEGQPDEALLNVDEALAGARKVWQDTAKTKILKKYILHSVSLQGRAPSELPKWFPQVMKTIEAAAATSKDAQAFVEFSREAAKAGKVANAEEGAKPN